MKCFLFTGSQILSTLTSKNISSDDECYQFCYIDASNRVQGRSKPFRLHFESFSELCISASNVFSMEGIKDDFVECEEDEDGEIVIIKPRVVYLEEELSRANSTVKKKEVSYNLAFFRIIASYC